MLTKIGFAPLILITLGLINLINAQNRNQVLSSTQTALQQISAGSEQFSLNLFKHLSAEVAAIEYDFIVSPFSVWSLLTLTAEGADGNTYAELQNVLGLPNDLFYIREGYKNIQKAFKINTTTVELAVEQVLFSDLNRPVEYEFQDKLQRIYEADFQSVDFQQQKLTTERINNYIRQATRGRISKIVTREDVKNSQMMLLSAIYFKGQWKFPFNISATQTVPFYDENGNDIGTVNMMYNSGPYPYTNVPELNAFAVELPYGNEDRLSMIVLLPKKRSNLTNVIDQLPQLGMTNLLNKLRAAEALYANDETEVFLPRFRITSDFTLNLLLNNMGINDIFSPLHVNLSKIRKQSDLYLSRIIHKAQIDVNEEGTVAAAASGGSFINKMTPPTFYANRPFAYLIYEKTTNILVFCGQVKNAPKLQF